MYVNLAIDTKSRYMDSLYTYAAPDGTAVGDVFRVPFNKNNKERLGYVFETDVVPECDVSQIKEVTSKVEEYSLNAEMMKTIAWMRTRYGIKYIDAIHCFIPPGKPAKPGREKRPYRDMVPEEQNIDALTDEQSVAVGEIRASMDALFGNDASEGIMAAGENEAASENEAAGESKAAGENEAAGENGASGDAKPGTANQFFLLKGVTSSGKTEVYMQAIEHALELGRTAIMLVPEIALTKQVIERFAGRFGREKIAVLHSHLTQRERFDEWMRLRKGEAKIAIGARIGVFAPLDDIGVIILDEEHESTYKSDQTPKYETVDIAVKRLMSTKGVLILGSATPSVVSYERAQEGVYKLIELKKRFNETLLPEVRIVDMREELRHGNRGIFSDALASEIKTTLEKGEQVILFMNRRGYSTYVQCRECGEPLKCPECGITLVYHKNYRAAGKYAASLTADGAAEVQNGTVAKGNGAAVCHYCGRSYAVPSACPACGGRELRYMGTGTEKVQELAERLFPDAVVDRLDLDTAKSTKEINRIIGDFSKKKTNILVGTQLVAKGLDFDNVGLVGIISADVSLNIPDYRSTERTYQLVTQAAGRSGRGEERGRVIIQTFTPENFALTAAKNSSYEDFFGTEIKFRQMMDYPPFTDLIAAEFTSGDEQQAQDAADECRNYLIRAGLPGAEKIFAPRPTDNFKGENGFRYHILIKSPKGVRNKYIYYLTCFGDKMVTGKRGCAMTIDVNPYSTF